MNCYQAAINIEICGALKDVRDQAALWGTPCVYVLRSESGVERDKLGAIKQRALEKRYDFMALDVQRQPDRKTLEKAGLREGVEMMLYTPMLSWIDYGLVRRDPDQIGNDFAAVETIRSTVIIDGSEWKIKDKGLSGRISWMPLYISFGLARV